MRQRPNILWVVTTQWRAQATGFAGDANARTPNLDAFAGTSAHFTQAVTPHPFGPFARAALLTGIGSPANGVRGYFDPLPAGTRTIAHDLAECGYETAFFGKWHLAPRDPAAPLVGEAHATTIVPPEHRGGFSLWEGFESGFLLNDPWLHGTRLPAPTLFAGYQADVVCQRAGSWLAERRTEERPWFCVVSLEPPHPPYNAAAGTVPARDPATLQLRPNVPPESETQARRELAGYHAHLTAADAAIGRLLGCPAAEGAAIVVTSVHGDMHGSHGLFRKGWPHEESIRVPLQVRAPASQRDWTGRKDAAVTLLDVHGWTRTWASGKKARIPTRPWQEISMPSVVRLPHQCDRVWRGIRSPRRKLIVEETEAGMATPWLFFDLERDPFEQRNLVADPAYRSELEALLGHLAVQRAVV